MQGLNDVLAFGDFTEDAVLSVEPGAGNEGDEELRAVGVGASVGHGKEERLGVVSVEVLIGDLGAIDRLSTSAVLGGKITTLSHEISDDSVEGAALVAEGLAHLANALLTSAESAEVLRSLGSVSVERELDSASGLAVDVDVKENCGVCHLTFYLLLLLEGDPFET